MERHTQRIYDEYLVSASIAGDADSLSRLVIRWQPRLFRHVWRMLGDIDRAKDVVQDVWMEILRGLPRLDDTAAFPSWAYRIATRRCYREFGRIDRAPSDLDEDESLAIPAPVTDSGEFAAEVAEVVAAIAQLPALQRAASALFYIDELSVAEIAIAMDVPPGTVKTRLMHARRKVRALLEGESS